MGRLRKAAILARIRTKSDGHNLLEMTAVRWIEKLQLALRRIDLVGFYIAGVDYNDPDYGLQEEFEDE